VVHQLAAVVGIRIARARTLFIWAPLSITELTSDNHCSFRTALIPQREGLNVCPGQGRLLLVGRAIIPAATVLRRPG
jgi:hypothetical protein